MNSIEMDSIEMDGIEMDSKTAKERIIEVIKAYRAEGRYVEAAYVMFCAKHAPRDITDEEMQIGREIFFGGACYVFASIVVATTEDKGEPTKKHLDYIKALNTELRFHVSEMMPTQGSA